MLKSHLTASSWYDDGGVGVQWTIKVKCLTGKSGNRGEIGMRGRVWCYEHLPLLMSINITFITINPEQSEWVSYDSDKRKGETQTSDLVNKLSSLVSDTIWPQTWNGHTRECSIMFPLVPQALAAACVSISILIPKLLISFELSTIN